MTRILIADDHAIVRRGLREILEHEFKQAVWGEAEDAQQTLAQIQQKNWDLVLLDIEMKGRSGLDVLKEVKQIRPELRVLVLSMYSEDQYGKRVLKAGAFGFMNKESAPEELVKAIRSILAGGCYVSPVLAEKLAWDLSANVETALHEKLSDRELEVLRMIATGKTVSQVADELHLSGATVSTYRARILEKLNLMTTAELIRYALANHLVE